MGEIMVASIRRAESNLAYFFGSPSFKIPEPNVGISKQHDGHFFSRWPSCCGITSPYFSISYVVFLNMMATLPHTGGGLGRQIDYIAPPHTPFFAGGGPLASPR